jgi:hypothetical protein
LILAGVVLATVGEVGGLVGAWVDGDTSARDGLAAAVVASISALVMLALITRRQRRRR